MKVFPFCILLIVLSVQAVLCKVIGNKNYSLEPGKAKFKPVTETTSDQLIKDLLNYHTVIRQLHGCAPLEYSDSLKDYARLRAMLLAFYEGKSQSMSESLHLDENVWFQPKETETNASTVIHGWYHSQLANWNFSSPKITPKNRDFAQMVWKGTHQMGCGQAYSARSNPGTYTICYYFPAGLTPSLESVNVLPLTLPSSAISSQKSSKSTVDPNLLDSIIEGMIKG